MTEHYDSKDRKLDNTGGLSDHDLDDARITDQERDDLATRRHVKQRDWQERITLEQYLEAKRKLDSVKDRAERESAQRIVDEYDRQGHDKQSETTL